MTIRSYLLTASLLAAIPSTFAQAKPAAISIMTGPAMAAAAAATPAAQASTVMIGIGAANSSATARSPSSTGTTGAGAGAQNVWVIKAGSTNGSLTFSPDTVNAAVGDMLQFQFYPRNHSVVMGDFAKPCEPAASTDPMAFFSGFMPTSAMGQLTYSVMVKNTNPMFIYCSQAKHCQEGMVAVINPPTTGAETLANYKQRAAQAPNNVSPASPSGGAGSTANSTTPAGGEIGGNAGATPSGPSVAPAAATTKKSAATAFRISSWSLVIVAAVACMAL